MLPEKIISLLTSALFVMLDQQNIEILEKFSIIGKRAKSIS